MCDHPAMADRVVVEEQSEPAVVLQVDRALALIAEMSREFAASQDVDSMLEPALSKIVDQLEAEVGSLWLVEEDEIVCHASVGPDPITGLRLNRGEGIIGRAIRECACQRVLDVRDDPNSSASWTRMSACCFRSIRVFAVRALIPSAPEVMTKPSIFCNGSLRRSFSRR